MYGAVLGHQWPGEGPSPETRASSDFAQTVVPAWAPIATGFAWQLHPEEAHAVREGHRGSLISVRKAFLRPDHVAEPWSTDHVEKAAPSEATTWYPLPLEFAAMPTMLELELELELEPTIEPRKPASPKLKTPPSEATSQ